MAAKQKRWNEETSRYSSLDYMPVNTSPEDLVVQVDDRKYIIEQIMALPYSESQVIFLRYYKQMKIEDIAYMMDISKSTVKRYLSSGKKRLARLMKTQGRGYMTGV